MDGLFPCNTDTQIIDFFPSRLRVREGNHMEFV